MNILITGHTGFLGRSLINYLSENANYNLFGVSRSIKGDLKCYEYSLNITDKNKLKQIIAEKRIDCVIHLAGKSIVQDCDADPYDSFYKNSLGVASVLEACRNTEVKKVLVSTTDKVYGTQKNDMAVEDDELNPNSPYEFAKSIASSLIDFYRKYYNMDIIEFRCVNIIGGDDSNTSRILPKSFRCIVQNEPITIYENSVESYRDFVYTKDVARAIHIMIENNTQHHVYNISSNNSISIMEFVQKVLKITKCGIEPIVVNKKTDFKEIPYQSIDGSRFISEFNFKYTDLDQVIKDSFENYKLKNYTNNLV